MRKVKEGNVVVYCDGRKEYFALVKAILPNNRISLVYINEQSHPWEPSPVDFIIGSESCDYWRFLDINLKMD